MFVEVHPVKTATKLLNMDREEGYCESIDPLKNSLRLDALVRGDLVREITDFGTEVGYFDFENHNQVGPFMVYFQLDYDVTQEGIMAVVLS